MSILDKIVAEKRRQFLPETSFTSERPGFRSNDFLAALKRDGISIIGEIKPRSPSAGDLLEAGQLDSILQVYRKRCAAISALTDEKYFGGSFELLSYVKRFTGLPVLCKDFVVSKTQIRLARQHGADAVLLIAKTLTKTELEELFAETKRETLIAVVEVNNEQDLSKLESIPAQVILINNRNLDTMEIDLGTTAKLAGALNPDAIVISASGIKTNSDLEKLLPFTKNFLIGTSLMQSLNLERQLADFQSVNLDAAKRRLSKTLIKICGITNLEDANLAIDCGADLVGLIFASGSPRNVNLETALTICDGIRNRTKIVGVFQNQTADQVNRISEHLNLDYVQLHGDEDAGFISQCTKPVIKAIQYRFERSALDQTAELVFLNGKTKLQNLSRFKQASFLLFDATKDADAISSHTVTADKLFNRLAQETESLPPFIFAGRLSPDTVSGAIKKLRPFAVDVASGIETAPGVKSRVLMQAFCQAVKENPTSINHTENQKVRI
jgi:indole-3-glycerol phosphate synthase/phosphoribosylanthranilate isomerase